MIVSFQLRFDLDFVIGSCKVDASSIFSCNVVRYFGLVSERKTIGMHETPANMKAIQKDHRHPNAGETNPDTIGPNMGPNPVTFPVLSVIV